MNNGKTPLQSFLNRERHGGGITGDGRRGGNAKDENMQEFLQSLSLAAWNSQIRASWAAGRSDQIVEKILDLELAMSAAPAISQALGTAFLSPLADKGLLVAKESFADLPEIISKYVSDASIALDKYISAERFLPGMRSIAHEMNAAWSGASLKAEHARSTLGSFGFTADESEALMREAFVLAGLDIIGALPEKRRLLALAGLNELDTSRLNNNAIALELCSGTFGAERLRLSSDPVASGLTGILYGRSMSEQDCRLTDLGAFGIGSLLNGLERRWDVSGSAMDEVSRKKVAALLDLKNEIAIAFGEAHGNEPNPYAGKHSKITVAVEHGMIAAASDAASEIGIPTPRSWEDLASRISSKRSQEQAPGPSAGPRA